MNIDSTSSMISNKIYQSFNEIHRVIKTKLAATCSVRNLDFLKVELDELSRLCGMYKKYSVSLTVKVRDLEQELHNLNNNKGD